MNTMVTQGKKSHVDWGDAKEPDCPQLPGTILRIFIPAGAVINLLNLIEIASPSGICLIVRIPLLNSGIDNLVDSIRNAGGTVEFVGVGDSKKE